MAHRFPIAEIIESWGGNYTVQAEVVLSKYHYHQIRMKGWRGSSTQGWRRPRGEASQHTFLTLHLSQCPHAAPTTTGQPYITQTQTRGRLRRHNNSSVRGQRYDENDTSEWKTDKRGDNMCVHRTTTPEGTVWVFFLFFSQVMSRNAVLIWIFWTSS